MVCTVVVATALVSTALMAFTDGVAHSDAKPAVGWVNQRILGHDS